MNLDPTVSPWIGIFASTGVCLWMVAIGAPLARAVFGDRPRPVWPFLRPRPGHRRGVAHDQPVGLRHTRRAPAPGSASWPRQHSPRFVAWRDRRIRLPSLRTALASLTLLLASIGTYVLAFSSRTQVRPGEESWHYALALRMARGDFPPVTPYGQDVGIGYHYGPDLLAASIVNTAGVPPWTAVAVLTALLVVALVLAAVGFAWDVGAPLPLAVGAGAVLGLIVQPVHVGLPPYVATSGDAGGLFGLVAGLAPDRGGVPFEWVHKPHWALALCIVLLVAAALEAGTGRRQAVLIAAAAGVMALAAAAVLVFASIALGAVGVSRLFRLDGRQRLVLASALAIAALLAALGGGPVSDTLFQRGGTTGMVRIAFEPDWQRLAPFDLTGPALMRVGIVPLITVSAITAYSQRSWGLAYLTAASGFGLVASVFLQSALPFNDARILFLASATAAFAALAGTSSLDGQAARAGNETCDHRSVLLGVLPTALPRATAGLRLAAEEGFAVGQPVVRARAIRT